MTHYAVLDTNVIVSGLWSSNKVSPPVCIYDALIDELFVPVFSSEIIAEYRKVLNRAKFDFDPDEVSHVIRHIMDFGLGVTPAEPADETFPDPDDKVFYCTALAAQGFGAVLVTGNARHYPPAPFVVSPADFAAMLG